MNRFKIAKYVQLFLSIIFIIVYFLVMLLVPQIRYSVFTNKSIFVLCLLMWILCIVTLGFVSLDLKNILQFEIKNHELSREAYLDGMTGMPNRHALDAAFTSYTVKDRLSSVGCVIFSIENLREINEAGGHLAGDRAIKDFTDIFERVGDGYGFVARNGGNEYLALLDACTEDKVKSLIKEMEESIEVRNGTTNEKAISINYAYALNANENANGMSELISATYRKLEH